jgi:hypothetical protein
MTAVRQPLTLVVLIACRQDWKKPELKKKKTAQWVFLFFFGSFGFFWFFGIFCFLLLFFLMGFLGFFIHLPRRESS